MGMQQDEEGPPPPLHLFLPTLESRLPRVLVQLPMASKAPPSHRAEHWAAGSWR